jgi:hypothetical protein
MTSEDYIDEDESEEDKVRAFAFQINRTVDTAEAARPDGL